MDDSESSCLLKTPTAQLAVNGGSQHPDKRREGGHGPTLADEVEFLLPTPSAADGTGGHMNRSGDRSHELLLPGVARELALLPTPAVNDMGEGKTVEHWDSWTAAQQEKHGNGNGRGKSLAIEAQRLLPTPRAARGASGTETMYAFGAERSDQNRPQGEVLLPTPRAQNGEERNQNIYKRPLDQPQNLENALARLPGEITLPLFSDGSES